MKCTLLYFSVSVRYQENLVAQQGPVLTHSCGGCNLFDDLTSIVPGWLWVCSHQPCQHCLCSPEANRLMGAKVESEHEQNKQKPKRQLQLVTNVI